MEIIVCKFGGTSTASADRFRQIKRILDIDPRRRYVALSAPGVDRDAPKVTDLLYKDDIDSAAHRFEQIGDALGLRGAGKRARRELETARERGEAYRVSRGEALCALLFSEYAGIPCVDAARVIRFDGSGRLDVPETLRRIKEMAKEYPRAVLPGFYGSGPEGNIHLLPRNGSDITGALLAAGVGAALYENWTDVPGLMTGDPNTDPDAEIIPQISYAEMRRMAKAGARVLHPDCLEPVEAAGIPTRLKCTLRPELPGTLIR